MSAIVEAVGLCKSFGRVHALDHLEFTAQSGQVTAILGPNGAGKTTFVRLVATLVAPDSGSLHVAGVDARQRPQDVRRLIGLAGQAAAVEPSLSGRENLELVGRLYGLDRRQLSHNVAAVLRQLGLVDHADRPARSYSGGIRRKLDLGASLVGAPKLLLLDEPTTGLDPLSRIELWDAIRGLVANGTDVVMTTQYLDEADQLAQQIVIVDAGKVIAGGTPDELKANAGRDVIEIEMRDRAELVFLANAVRNQGVAAIGEATIDEAGRHLAIPTVDGPRSLARLLLLLGELSLPVDGIALRRPTLDEVFLALTGARPETPVDSATTAGTHAA